MDTESRTTLGSDLRKLAADIEASPGTSAFDIKPGKPEDVMQAEHDEADQCRKAKADRVIDALNDLAQQVENGTEAAANATRAFELVEDFRGGLPPAEVNLLADIINRARA